MGAVKDRLSRRPTQRAAKRPHRFGAHLSIAGGMHKALRRALEWKLDTVQVFVKNQRQWRAAPFKPDDLDRWRALRDTPGFGPVVAHATYLINLASEDESLCTRSRQAFAEELHRCHVLGIRYLVVHPGAAGQQPRERAAMRIAAALNRIFAEHPDLDPMVLLETTAGQGTALGSSFAELGAIVAAVRESERIGVCIDTCHVFAAGYDIRDPDKYAHMITEVRRTVGLARVRCWHLNDSSGECGQHRDRHAHIGRGRIGTAGFRNLLADRRFMGLPMIIETPKGRTPGGSDWDRVNVRRLRAIAARSVQGGVPRRDRRRARSAGRIPCSVHAAERPDQAATRRAPR